ncbi:hypothetical protein OAO18_04720 [Francisellaceae bacterium]|nr:hypothetical protein [Francisellaceae bacterium]
MKRLSNALNSRFSLPLILCFLVPGGFADTIPSANVSITFENSINPAFVETGSTSTDSSDQDDTSSTLLAEYSSVLYVEYMSSSLSIKVGESVDRPVNNVKGYLDTNGDSLYALNVPLPNISVMYKHIKGGQGDYPPNQQCVITPKILNIISFTQKGSNWEISGEQTIPKQDLNINENNMGGYYAAQTCSNFNFEYALNMTPVSGSQDEFNINFTFYISLNKNGVEALNKANKQISEANNPNYNAW